MVMMAMEMVGTVMLGAKTWAPGVCLQRGNPLSKARFITQRPPPPPLLPSNSPSPAPPSRELK